MNHFRFFILLGIMAVVLPCGIFPSDINPPDSNLRGDAAMAERYALWAKDMIDQGLWSEALAGLERAADFADVSSDILYLLALARSHERRPIGDILEVLTMALEVGRWNMFTPNDALLLRAENLITIRAYAGALQDLSKAEKSLEETGLVLKALAASSPDDFLRVMEETLDRYPRETKPVRIFLGYLKNKDSKGLNPVREELQLLELVVRRLPVLLLRDAELAWMAAPFMRDTAEARRQLQAYRAINKPVKESLPPALALGIIDEETALEELFDSVHGKILDNALLGEIWNLLRREEARSIFRRNLSLFSGVITEGRDGIPDSSAEYRNGMLISSSYNMSQDGIPDMVIRFEAGIPQSAKVYIPPEYIPNLSGFPYKGSRREALIQWERYPAVLDAELDGARFIYRPLTFFFSPITVDELWRSGVYFPRLDPYNPPLTRRYLVSQALRVERPSLEFNNGIEVIELNQGIPAGAREYIGELMVSETEFQGGRPLFQRVDLNADGRMDTMRFFRRVERQVELEDLWDYDRNIDYTVSY